MDCPNSGPPHQSTVSSFALDKYEVTVGRFRKFVNAYVSNTASAPAVGAGVNPAIPGTGWQSGWNTSLPSTPVGVDKLGQMRRDLPDWTDAAEANENTAINCVDWYEALAFCIWDGGRLPTESEWEYAAAEARTTGFIPGARQHRTARTRTSTREPCIADPAIPKRWRLSVRTLLAMASGAMRTWLATFGS